MNDKYILDAAGEPHPCEDLFAWGRWMQTADRHVAKTFFGEVWVSTVFLGLDHSFREIDAAMGRTPGPAILWESMVFGGPLDGEQRRYATRAEADAGHTALCMAVVRALEVGTAPTRDERST